MKNKIPKGWTNYLPYGDKVEGTKLFPFKTPLRLEMQSNIPKVKWFTPACLIANKPELKVVIDLTDTDVTADRYYSPKAFLDSNVEHLKMRISGGGLVPGRDKIKQFSDAVDGFLRKYANDPDALIGVHCTHGLNRTGYFICMYMVTRMGCNPVEAIDKFQRARGYEMYRQNFIEEIMEPGKHSSGFQKPKYGGDAKLGRQIGNYSYENTWMESNSKKPFRGFREEEAQRSGEGSWHRQMGFGGRRVEPFAGETSRGFPQGTPRVSLEESGRRELPRGPWRNSRQFGEGREPGGSWNNSVGNVQMESFPPLGSYQTQGFRAPSGSERVVRHNPLQSDASLSECGNPWRSTGNEGGIWRRKPEGRFGENSRDHMEYRSPLDGQYSEDAPRWRRQEGFRSSRRGRRAT